FGQLASFHPFGKPNFLLHGEKIGFADLLQIESYRVSYSRCYVFGIGRSLLGAIRGRDTWAIERLRRRLVEDLYAFCHQGRVEFLKSIEMLFGVGEGRDNLV